MFIDEAGVTTAMTRTYARAPRGQRAYGTAPAGRWRRLTVLGALGLDGVAAAMTIEAATDTAVFLAFLDHVLIPELVRAKPGAVVILDHLSPHKAPAVRERLDRAELSAAILARPEPDRAPVGQGQGGAAGGGGAHGRGAGDGAGRRPGPGHARRRPRLLPRLRLRHPCQLTRKSL